MFQVKIRSSAPAQEALVSPLANDQIKVSFAEPQAAITPGQAAVFYLDDLVAGGAIIEEVLS